MIKVFGILRVHRLLQFLVLIPCVALFNGCKTAPPLGTIAKRVGDEIVVAGQMVHAGTRVVLWMDPSGYDAYRVERRFSPLDKSGWEDSQAKVRELTSPSRYNLRRNGLTAEELERVRGGGWDLPTLQRVVDQFVIHFDACGTSRQCFNVLQDHRDLSVHFMLDLDGTIYQTLDLKERAWHATTSNSRSVGIEIANIGAYGADEKNPQGDWYAREPDGNTLITIPARFGDGGIRTGGFIGHPARRELVTGTIQSRKLVQYDFTPAQYRALIHLAATLGKVLPGIKCEYPRDGAGRLAEGSSIRSIERIPGIHRDTIMRLGVRIGQECARIQNAKMRNIHSSEIQIDEIWGFVGAKRKNAATAGAYGDVWTFIALDRDTKLIPSFWVGQRIMIHARYFLQDLKSRLASRIQFSSDGLAAYGETVGGVFGSEVDYGQIVKTFAVVNLNKDAASRYSPAEVVKTEKTLICGMPDVNSISTHTLKSKTTPYTCITEGSPGSPMHSARSLRIFKLPWRSTSLTIISASGTSRSKRPRRLLLQSRTTNGRLPNWLKPVANKH